MITGIGNTYENGKMFYRKSFADFFVVVSKGSVKAVGHQKLLILLITSVNATSNQFTIVPRRLYFPALQ
jgi:hypothetical protein